MAQRHHYIPRFCLAGFSAPRLAPKHEPFVWVRTRGASWEKRSPKKVAQSPDLYRIDPAQAASGAHVHDYSIEEALAALESDVAPVIRKLDARKIIADHEEAALAQFIALLACRVPRYMDGVRDSMSRLGQLVLSTQLEAFTRDPARFTAYMERFRAETGSTDDVSIEDLRKYWPTMAPTHTSVVGMSLGSAETIARWLLSMKWSFVRCTASAHLITSDAPYSVVDLHAPQRGFVGLANPRAHVYVPLSKTLGFVARWEGPERQWLPGPGDFVRFLNCLTMRYADKIVVASTTAFPGHERLTDLFDAPLSRGKAPGAPPAPSP